jgi:hypothetical protein
MASKAVKNEQRKLGATFFNNIGVGCVILGLIGPATAGKFAVVSGLPEIMLWVLALVFHTIGRFQLSFLEE